MKQEFQTFLENFEAEVIPLSRETALAYFNATISGKEEDYARVAENELKLSKIFADPQSFSVLRNIRESGAITDPMLHRQLDALYHAYLEKQMDEKTLEEIIRLQNVNEMRFATFRTTVDDRTLTDNEVELLLRTSKDHVELEAVWKASKEIGAVVAEDVLRLVKLRNKAARDLGFDNYHQMQLTISEQDAKEIEELFNELDELTGPAFAQLKERIDVELAKGYGIPVEELMPWHYQNRFFQEAPKLYDIDLDAYYRDKDIVALTKSYFSGIALPIDDLVGRSDLYEKEGKYQHAYCTNIDRAGDVRVICNIKPSYNWMNTTLHEYGHAVYDKFNDPEVPWILREPAHTFTTEAIAMLFGRLAANPEWITRLAGVPSSEIEQVASDLHMSLRLEQLVFSRWVQVMYRFEKAMYEDPDQDLNALWWRLVEQYQMLRKPEGRNHPDWASKIHVALYPAYYHNYLMGELLASQLHAHICTRILGVKDKKREAYIDRPEVGMWLVDNVFKPGRTLHWNELIENATGEKLTAKYYAEQFVH